MTGQYVAGILDPRKPLHLRFKKVSDLTGRADRKEKQDAGRPGQTGKKQGFTPPLPIWLKNELRDLVQGDEDVRLLIKTAGRLEGDVDDVTNRYLEACIVSVSVDELAQMGATLANGGVQPVSGRRVLSAATTRTVLSAMVIAGMYEDSGRWWTQVGLPAKSGVSGNILAVVPGWGAIVAYSPRLDAAGNSVRGAIAIRQLVDRWGLHSIDRLLSRARSGAGAP